MMRCLQDIDGLLPDQVQEADARAGDELLRVAPDLDSVERWRETQPVIRMEGDAMEAKVLDRMGSGKSGRYSALLAGRDEREGWQGCRQAFIE